jgi:hypothetical protein
LVRIGYDDVCGHLSARRIWPSLMNSSHKTTPTIVGRLGRDHRQAMFMVPCQNTVVSGVASVYEDGTTPAR